MTQDAEPPAGDAGTPAEAGTSAARPVPSGEPHRLELGGFYIVDTASGFRNVDLTGMRPPRTTGNPVFTDVAGFAHYVARHGDSGSDIFADEYTRSIICVLDAHTEDWQAHTATLHMPAGDTTPWADVVWQVTEATGTIVMNGTPGD